MTPEQEHQGGQYIDLLDDFIQVATRWDVEAIRASVNDQFRFSIDFDWHMKNAVKYQAGFIQALGYIPDDNWKAWEKKTRSILPMLDVYLNWYQEHKEEVKDFDPYNPYRLMNDHIKGTREIILQYFPDPIETSVRKKGTKLEPPLENLLTDAGKKILPAIRIQYKDKLPADYAYLIMALQDLKFLDKGTEKTVLYRALKKEFGGDVGTYENFRHTTTNPKSDLLKISLSTLRALV